MIGLPRRGVSSVGDSGPLPLRMQRAGLLCPGRADAREYEAVRSHPQRYLALPGHEVEGALLVEHNEWVALAEKLFPISVTN